MTYDPRPHVERLRKAASIHDAMQQGFVSQDVAPHVEEQLFQACLQFVAYRAREVRRQESHDPDNELIFNFQDDSMKSIGEILFEWIMDAMGFAAIAWNPPPERSVFQVDQVRDAGQELIDAILRAMEKRYVPRDHHPDGKSLTAPPTSAAEAEALGYTVVKPEDDGPIRGESLDVTIVDEMAAVPSEVSLDGFPPMVDEAGVMSHVTPGNPDIEQSHRGLASCGHKSFEGDKCGNPSCENYVNIQSPFGGIIKGDA